MSAKSQLDRLVREGENIGSWAGKKIHKVEFLYEAAEKCRAEGYKQYQNQRLDISYVMFLRFAKFFDLIRTQPSLDSKSAAHKKCKLDLLAALSLMEELKAKLLVKYGESPAVAATAMAMTAPADEDVAELTQTLEARFNKLKPAPKPAAAPPAPSPTTAAYGGPAPAQGGGLGAGGAPPTAVSAMDALEARMARLQPPHAPAPAPDEPFADVPLATGAAAVAAAATACSGGVGGGGYDGGVGGGCGAACSVASSSCSSHTAAATGAAEALRAEALRAEALRAGGGELPRPPSLRVEPPTAAAPPAAPTTAPSAAAHHPAPPVTAPSTPSVAATPPPAAAGPGPSASASASASAPASAPPAAAPPAAPLAAPDPGPPPSYEFANTMYPKVARPIKQTPSGAVTEGRGRGASDAELRGPMAGQGEGASLYPSIASLGMREAPAAERAREQRPKDQRIKERLPPINQPQDHRSRLQRHMAVRGFQIKDVPGDNNCQFHALADQLEQVGIGGWNAQRLRVKTVQWLQDNGARPMDDGGAPGERTLLRDSVGVPNWKGYIREMGNHGVTWGDEATLLAASVLFKAEIVVISSVSEDYCHIVTPPDVWKVPLRTRLYLGHYHEYHYVSTRPL